MLSVQVETAVAELDNDIQFGSQYSFNKKQRSVYRWNGFDTRLNFPAEICGKSTLIGFSLFITALQISYI